MRDVRTKFIRFVARTVIFPAKTKVTELSTLTTVSIRSLLTCLPDHTEHGGSIACDMNMSIEPTMELERIACDSDVIPYYYCYAYNLQLTSQGSFVF